MNGASLEANEAEERGGDDLGPKQLGRRSASVGGWPTRRDAEPLFELVGAHVQLLCISLARPLRLQRQLRVRTAVDAHPVLHDAERVLVAVIRRDSEPPVVEEAYVLRVWRSFGHGAQRVE